MESGNRSDLPRFMGDHLYLHIPFCRERCDYCDFFTRTGVAPGRQRAIIDRISDQIETMTGNGRSGPFRTLYAGGGTPSSLAPEAEEALLELLSRYSGAAEVTVEINPEDVSPAYLERLRDAGVNRLSLGVQTLTGDVRRTIGRHTTIAETRRGLETVAERWGNRWTADLIVAVPGESEETVVRDLTGILAFEPSHLSVYELGIEDHTVLGNRVRNGRIAPIPEDGAVRHLRLVEDLLEQRGLRRYEISSYAVPGEESRHNLAYWRMRPHLGTGPGAVGTFPIPPSSLDLPEPGSPLSECPPRIARITNTRSFAAFLGDPDFGIEIEPLSPVAVSGEVCMMGLRTVEGFDDALFQRYAGGSFFDICRPTVDRYPSAFVPGTLLPDASATDPRIECAGIISPNDRADQDGAWRFIALDRRRWSILDAILVDLFRDIDEHRNSCGTDSCTSPGRSYS